MIDETLEKMRDSYYESIILLQEEKDIKEALPKPEYQNFFALMDGLISKLINEYEEFKSLEDKDEEILEEIESLNRKINICKNLLIKVKNEISSETLEKQATYSKRHLIFAKTSSGTTFLEKDLKNIPFEYYDKVLSALDTLENGDIGSNTEKARPLVADKRLSGLFEIKEFKIRLIYRVLKWNTVYVMQVRMKKDNNSLIDKQDMINRNKNTKKEFSELKRNIENESYKLALINENYDIYQELKNFLEENNRNKKGGKNER